jgi:hypothetical protein
MSFNIEADRILYTLWDTLRPPALTYERGRSAGLGLGHPRELGLLVTLDVRMSHYALSGDEYHRAAAVYTVFTSNTSVFTYTTTLGRDSVRWRLTVSLGTTKLARKPRRISTNTCPWGYWGENPGVA